MGAVAIGAVLIAALLLIIAAMVWQESRHSPEGATALYLTDEAARFVHQRLSDEAASRLTVEDVTTILEWGLFHKQVVVGRSGSDAPVVGGAAEARFVAERTAQAGGVAYSPGDLTEVFALETGYLMSIGAVGEPVEEEPA